MSNYVLLTPLFHPQSIDYFSDRLLASTGPSTGTGLGYATGSVARLNERAQHTFLKDGDIVLAMRRRVGGVWQTQWQLDFAGDARPFAGKWLISSVHRDSYLAPYGWLRFCTAAGAPKCWAQ